MKRDIEVASQYAEILVSPDFRQAMTTAFDVAPSEDAYSSQRQATEEIIVSALRLQPNAAERAWEMRRQAAISELGGTSLGGFSAYIHALGGETKPGELTLVDLGEGHPEVVRTNSQILGLNTLHIDPIDFMEDALDVIDSQRKAAKGPENYATALKFFTDKYREFPSTHLDKAVIKNLVDRCMQGFIDITEDDRPNFVEMTNLYVAIRELPSGSFDKRFTDDIIGHSVDQLPTYNAKTLAMMIASLSKLDLSDTGESAATLVDLALRKTSAMERTVNMTQALRTIASLPPSPAAERVFASFLSVRNNLEGPQDIEGLDTTNYALSRIVENVIRDPELTQEAKTLAERCAAAAIRTLHRKQSLGDTTPDELERLKSSVRRIVSNFNRI